MTRKVVGSMARQAAAASRHGAEDNPSPVCLARDHGMASIGTPFAEMRREGWPWCLIFS